MDIGTHNRVKDIEYIIRNMQKRQLEQQEQITELTKALTTTTEHMTQLLRILDRITQAR